MSEIKIPNAPISYINAKMKTEIVTAIRGVSRRYRIPLFMLEGALSEILLDIKSESCAEMASETSGYIEELQKFYDKKEDAFIQSLKENSSAETAVEPAE